MNRSAPTSSTNDPSALPDNPGKRLILLLIISGIIIALAALVQLCAGSYAITIPQVGRSLFDNDVWSNTGFLGKLFLGDQLCAFFSVSEPQSVSTQTLIVWNIRLPRIIVAFLVGINLSFSGGIFQSITKNELASPYLLGVSSGAGLMIMLVLVIFPGVTAQLPLIAMAGGIVSFFLVYAIAWNHGTSPVRLILAGVIVSAIAGAIQTALFYMAKDITVVQNALAWTTGAFTGVGWERIRMILPWTIIAVVLAFSGSRYLDILLLGDATAKSLGMKIERTRFVLALIAILSAASSVAVAGLVGFVGLIVPHIVRSIVGSIHTRMLLGCMFVGPALLLSADTVARLLLNPVQIPVGIVTGIIGGCFFLYLMEKRREFAKL